jgi:hypothetical protein
LLRIITSLDASRLATRRIDFCNQILRFVHEEDLAKLQVTGKPKSIAIEICHLFLDQRYVITIDCIVMRLARKNVSYGL